MKQKSNYKNKAIGSIDVEKRGNVWKWHQKSFLSLALDVYLFEKYFESVRNIIKTQIELQGNELQNLGHCKK